MTLTKVFNSGNSQAVRVPKEFKLDDKEVYITKIGSSLIIVPVSDPWDLLSLGLEMFPEDFMKEGRNQPIIQEREGL